MSHIYPERESKTLEFKEQLLSFSSLIKTCVAFANTAGGEIIIGVKDGSREIIGISDADRERLYESFPNSLYDATNNGLFAHIYERNLNEVSIMIIKIPLSTRRPCYIKKGGIPKGVYLRVGTATRRATEDHIQELMRESRHQYYDQEPINLALEDLSDRKLTACYKGAPSFKKLLADGVITASFNNPEKALVTVAGALMFYDNPEQYIPEAIITCTEFSGKEGRNIIQTREISGSLPNVITDALALTMSLLEKNYSLKGPQLSGETIIPEIALREAITNAVMHRKYNIPGAVKIAIYEDRIEIFNPGCLPGLVDIENLGDGTTYLRNPHLTKIARRMKLIEKLGTGIKLILDECAAAGLKKPTFNEDGDFFKLTFSFEPDLNQTDSDEEKILKLLKFHEEATINQVMDALNVSRNTATRKLNKLIESGLIMREGKGPAVRYVLVK